MYYVPCTDTRKANIVQIVIIRRTINQLPNMYQRRKIKLLLLYYYYYYFKAVCHSKVTAKMPQSPHRSKKSKLHRHSSMGSYSGQGKGGGNRQHQKKKTPKKLPKQKAYAVTFKNSVPSGVTTTSSGERESR